MELQGKKAVTHDFLSLYKDSSHQDSKPPPQGSLIRTHDFLQPLERAEKSGGGGARGPGDHAPTPAAVGIKLSAAPAAAIDKLPGSAETVPPGGFCTYSLRHLTRYDAPARAVVEKPDWFTCALPSPGPGGADAKEGRSRPGRGVAGAEIPGWSGGTAGARLSDSYAAPAFALWEESAFPRGTGVLAARGPQPQPQQQQQWPSPSHFPIIRGGSSGSSPCVSSSTCGSALAPVLCGDRGRLLTGGVWRRGRQRMSRDTRPAMASGSKSTKGIADDDDDDDDEEEEEEERVGKREASCRKELTVKVDGGRDNKNCNDQRATTPRSKHSETEQRRRSKINDRFRILRDLIPQSDQKRDKASLLLEAIEYVQFLQEKVQKYESLHPGWNQDNAKLTPWKISRAPEECMVNPSHMTKNSPAPTGFTFPAESTIPGGTTLASNIQVVAESENVCSGLASKSASVSFPVACPVGAGGEFSQLQQRLISDSENMARQQAQWLRPCAMESSVSSDILSGEEELAIEKGTISLSSMYSEGLLTSLTQALRSSGINLSQASISVQINLGRHATMSKAKDRDGEELEQANKRHKSDTR